MPSNEDMISIFNGRARTLGQSSGAVYAQLSVDFRAHLHLFKGARLHVFLCIALHADEHGWAYPGIETRIKRETGYNRETIILALNDLCAMTIDGHRVLLAYQPVGAGGVFLANQYLIFPTAQEVNDYETRNPRRRKSRLSPTDALPQVDAPDAPPTSESEPAQQRATPSAGFPNTDKPNSAKPNTDFPNSENPHSKKNQSEAKPTRTKSKTKHSQPDGGGEGVLAQRATIVAGLAPSQVPVFEQLDALLGYYHVEGANRIQLATRLAADAARIDGAGEWREMALRVINCWRLCEKAHATGRVGNVTGFTGFFIHKLKTLDAAYAATGDERDTLHAQRLASDAVKLARGLEKALAAA